MMKGHRWWWPLFVRFFEQDLNLWVRKNSWLVPGHYTVWGGGVQWGFWCSEEEIEDWGDYERDDGERPAWKADTHKNTVRLSSMSRRN